MQMQEIDSIGGGARLFGGVGDRRLRAHHQNNQPLKCPRCVSLNTKFCYYNNYNLSQPRHFCKSCRRYWTNGGVLRNVPVGGGCRKTKRSKPKQLAAAAASPPTQQDDVQNSLINNKDKTSNSHSTSESWSSSLTATNAATTTNPIIDTVSSEETPTNDNNNSMFSCRIEAKTPELVSTNPSFEQAVYEQYTDIGSITGLMPTSWSENMTWGFGNMMNGQTASVEIEQGESLWEGGFEMKTMQNGGSSGEGLDWEGSRDEGLFHIPNAADQVYWSHNQWSADQDLHHAQYLP